MYFWISWVQPTEDYRSISFPPNNSILGWWRSGYDSQGKAILCAWVKATTKEHAKNEVIEEWPEVTEWRFCEGSENLIIYDRFPLSDWMDERFVKELKQISFIKMAKRPIICRL
jgi:hypothetical protein